MLLVLPWLVLPWLPWIVQRKTKHKQQIIWDTLSV